MPFAFVLKIIVVVRIIMAYTYEYNMMAGGTNGGLNDSGGPC